MLFDHEDDVLAWYQKPERVLTPAFIDAIPWKDIVRTPLNEAFLPVILYMRDIERFTSVYYEQLLQTPTSKDPVIRPFIDQWSAEEPLHGDLLNRFLEEAGHPISEAWYEDMRRKLPAKYDRNQHVSQFVSRCVGTRFTAVHMTWGAIQEFTTLNGYQRLWEKAGHPVLEQILRGIVREEARHAFFYWSMARIKLLRSSFSQALTRFLVDRFWQPVGQGAKSALESQYLIRTLFAGEEGVDFVDKRVNAQLQRLPGMEQLRTVRNTIAQMNGIA